MSKTLGMEGRRREDAILVVEQDRPPSPVPELVAATAPMMESPPPARRQPVSSYLINVAALVFLAAVAGTLYAKWKSTTGRVMSPNVAPATQPLMALPPVETPQPPPTPWTAEFAVAPLLIADSTPEETSHNETSHDAGQAPTVIQAVDGHLHL